MKCDTRTQINRTRTRETRARVRFFVRTCNTSLRPHSDQRLAFYKLVARAPAFDYLYHGQAGRAARFARRGALRAPSALRAGLPLSLYILKFIQYIDSVERSTRRMRRSGPNTIRHPCRIYNINTSIISFLTRSARCLSIRKEGSSS